MVEIIFIASLFSALDDFYAGKWEIESYYRVLFFLYGVKLCV